MDKKTILKKLLGEEIASYLRPIIREKADLMLSTKTPQHGFTKKGKSTIGVTVKFSENYINKRVLINFRDYGIAKSEIIYDLNKEDWLSYYKSHQTMEDLTDKVYLKISQSKKLPRISKIEILDKVKQIYGVESETSDGFSLEVEKFINEEVPTVLKDLPEWYVKELTAEDIIEITIFESVKKQKMKKEIYEYIKLNKIKTIRLLYLKFPILNKL